MAALLLALVLIINLAVHGWLGAILEVAALFLSLALAVNLAVYGWLGALGAYSAKEANRNERLVYLFIAGVFTGDGCGYLVRPRFRGWPVRVARPRPSSAERRYP